MSGVDPFWELIGFISLGLLELGFMARAIMRPHRDPASRVAWVVVIAVAPVFGMVAYILLGETSIGRKRKERTEAVLSEMPPPVTNQLRYEHWLQAKLPEKYEPVFRLGETINGFAPIGGNTARLMQDSNTAIDSMVADMDAATSHIHLIFYIWLNDNNGTKIVEALKRAAARGVQCRAMADGLGSRAMIKSKQWQDMGKAGVHVAVALGIGNPLLRPFKGRIDLRNHRKIVVIDDWITYCGSQNCADPEFRVKPKFAPWVDALMRFEGPIARQNQYVFISDWMTYVKEDIRCLLEQPMRESEAGFAAQVIATGPTIRNSAMSDTFETLMYAARHRLIITTPYYVPCDSMQSALCSAAHRGVDTTIVFPARNDSWQVAAASRGYYQELLDAGVKVHEYEGGLLHTKSLTLDGEVTLIGSANMDRRSFELNYENNILFYDPELTAVIMDRQSVYLNTSRQVSSQNLQNWSVWRHFWNNFVGMMSPVL